MKSLAHISDLHFGRENPEIADALLNEIRIQQPSVVIVSGDLTQRARRQQFKDAKGFLEQIPYPKIVVPGNHDIPLYNLFGRFIKKLSRFRNHISKNIDENYEDEELAIFGINTARSFTLKEGRISMEQIQMLEEKLSGINNQKLKILVTHHPLPELGRIGLALPILEKGGLDMLLTGHIHESSLGDLKTDLMLTDRSILAIGAGTAISTRTRGEPNSYNIIETEKNNITLKLRVWSQGKFRQAGTFAFRKDNDVWKKEDPVQK